MVLSRFILSRPIIHPALRWPSLKVLLLSLLFSSSVVDAGRHTNGTADNQYGIYTNFDPTIALVIVVLVCAFFLLGIFSMFVRHCSEPDVVTSLSAAAAASSFSRQIGLDPADIEKFPIFFYSEVKHVKIGRETLECAICLGEFEDDETLRLLPKCNHVFHPECIDEWLTSHVTCPVCRGVLAVDSAEAPKVSPQETEADLLNQESIAANRSQSSNEVAITVHAEQNQDSTLSIQTKNRQPRSSISGRFPRSHSTGHSLVQGGENRYTLRMPEEVRTQITANAKLKRTLSVNLISTKESSTRKGEGSSRGKQVGWPERWSILINPAFVLKGSSLKPCSKIDNIGDSDSVNGRNLLAAVKLNCLGLKAEGAEEGSTGVRAPV